ncbi:hypothetical protein V5799_032214 [Amblyomma americanum]|uniref:Uncharacterized protein n=1 Tax=Amblyomma americanum TaxID=6943 RepID=A0AAQ4DRT7_AMBAM
MGSKVGHGRNGTSENILFEGSECYGPAEINLQGALGSKIDEDNILWGTGGGRLPGLPGRVCKLRSPGLVQGAAAAMFFFLQPDPPRVSVGEVPGTSGLQQAQVRYPSGGTPPGMKRRRRRSWGRRTWLVTQPLHRSSQRWCRAVQLSSRGSRGQWRCASCWWRHSGPMTSWKLAMLTTLCFTHASWSTAARQQKSAASLLQ